MIDNDRKNHKVKNITVVVSVILAFVICFSAIYYGVYQKNRAREDGYCFIDIDGNIVSKAYKDSYSFYDGVTMCFDEEPTVGQDEVYLINSDMKVLGGKKYIDTFIIWSSYNGETIFVVLEGNSIQILDKNMETITSIPYNAHGIDKVSEVAGEVGENGLFPIKDYKSGLWGYMDINGNMVIEPKFSDAESFKGNFAVVGKWGEQGVIDSEGNYKIEPTFHRIELCQNGIAFAKRNKSDECGLFIDMDGNVLSGENFIYNYYECALSEISEDIFPVKDSETGLIGFVDKNIKYQIEPKYYNAYNFSNGLAPVMNKDELWGYVDTTGKEVIPCQYEWADSFGEYDLASVEDVDGKWGLIRKDGSYYIEPSLPSIQPFACGYAKVRLKKGQKVEICK